VRDLTLELRCLESENRRRENFKTGERGFTAIDHRKPLSDSIPLFMLFFISRNEEEKKTSKLEKRELK
jgi:hypothetical protein